MICGKCGYEINVDGVKFCPRCGTETHQQEITKTKEMIDDHINRVWSDWHTIKVLGKGSFGTVYEVVRKSKNIERHG